MTAKSTKNRTDKQLLLGQYFTPEPIAKFMASQFTVDPDDHITILDPGAGQGALGNALSNRIKDAESTYIECDQETVIALKANVQPSPHTEIIEASYIDKALDFIKSKRQFSHIIMNPPYFKLKSDSNIQKLLRSNGIIVPNMYAAFIWLSLHLLEEDGQLVAIVPRSFCNGVYYTKFRNYLVSNFSIEMIHVFDSRSKAFSSDKVLQENVIIKIKNSKQRKEVLVSSSADGSFNDIEKVYVPIDNVIRPNDIEQVIHLPHVNHKAITHPDAPAYTLSEIGLEASTGPVVDFRVDEIQSISDENTIPLIYPGHIRSTTIQWPSNDKKFKKGQYIRLNDRTKKLSTSIDGAYVLVKRFSSKEEKRRVQAAVLDVNSCNSDIVGIENHLNYFHIAKHGFDAETAAGLCEYLNSEYFDVEFRLFSGHTQVNVGDLRRMPYPSREQLRKNGRRILNNTRQETN